MSAWTAADAERVRGAVRRLVQEHHLPGIAVGVVRGDELVFAEGFGYADIESSRPQDPGLRQRIGSITKTMTGLCVMALVDEGRLSLDSRVVELLPEATFHGPADSLTIRHLLTHTGGIGEAPNVADLPRFEALLFSETLDTSRVPESFPDGITIEVEPGTKWAYANHGFALLGEIVMRTEGALLEDVFRQRIFAPLGMTNTDCRDEPHPDLTTGYHRAPSEDERALRERADLPVADEAPVDGHNIRGRYQYLVGMSRRASGAVQSTVYDMARYASALLRGGGGLVRPGTFERMLAPQWCPDDRLTSLGLSFFREWRFGRRAFEHGGGVAGGWNTLMSVLPDDDLAVLIHLNLAYDKFGDVSDGILQVVLDAPALAVPARPTNPALLATAPGVYEAPLPGPLTNFRLAVGTGRVQLSARDGALWLHARRGQWKGGVRLLPADADDPAFFLLDTGGADPPRIALVRDGAPVTGLRLVQDCAIELVRTEQVAPWA